MLPEFEGLRTGVGALGTVLFGARWPLQMWTSRRRRISTVTMPFWVLSAAGSGCLSAYFLMGVTADWIGLISQTMPLTAALFNIILMASARRRKMGVQ